MDGGVEPLSIISESVSRCKPYHSQASSRPWNSRFRRFQTQYTHCRGGEPWNSTLGYLGYTPNGAWYLLFRSSQN